MENQRFGIFLNKYWFLVFSLSYGMFVGLPFIAPVLMELGLAKAANVIYTIYSFLCHQFPQRSFFFFGEKFMYSLAEVQDAWQVTINPLVLRRFLGNPEMGWKVAWSDRMISMYTSILLVSWIWYPFRKRLANFPIWGFFIFLIPMALDGTTHMISDFAGIGQGFRDHNVWLAEITNYQFLPAFYSGDGIGSFNSWMRLVSGLSFGIGVVLFGFPYLDEVFESNLAQIVVKQTQIKQLRENALNKISDRRIG
jgi:uncharacterized membrane protein